MHYSAYGMGLSCSEPIPRLEGASPAATIDVRIELGATPPWFHASLPSTVRYASRYLDANGVPALTATELPDGWLRLAYTDGATFLIDAHGTEVWVQFPPSLTLDDVSSYLLGPVLGLVACLHGRACLHASGVAIDGRAIALVGPPGAGKSTTAGAFGALGYPVLADDVMVLEPAASGLLAYPGYPRLRLWPASVPALDSLGASIPSLPPDWGERRYHFDISGGVYTFQRAPLPLGAVYVLSPRSGSAGSPHVEAVTGREVLMSLVTNTFAGRLLDREMRAREFDIFSQAAASVPIRRVTPLDDRARIAELCDAVVADYRGLREFSS